jgi:hypothetical protein
MIRRLWGLRTSGLLNGALILYQRENKREQREPRKAGTEGDWTMTHLGKRVRGVSQTQRKQQLEEMSKEQAKKVDVGRTSHWRMRELMLHIHVWKGESEQTRKKADEVRTYIWSMSRLVVVPIWKGESDSKWANKEGEGRQRHTTVTRHANRRNYKWK